MPSQVVFGDFGLNAAHAFLSNFLGFTKRLLTLAGYQGETFCPNRVARFARLAGIRAQIGYKRRPGKYGGKPSIVVDNTLNRQFEFDVGAPNQFWVTDIKTYEGFSYLAVVIDLYARRVAAPLSVNLPFTSLSTGRCSPASQRISFYRHC